MANNEYINRVDFGNDTLIDISDTTAEVSDVLEGQIFYTRSGAPATGTLGDATQSTHGLMSASDKVKLDEIDTGAQAWNLDKIINNEVYSYRKTPVDADDEILKKIVGGTVAWNQLIKELSSANYGPESGVTVTYDNGVATITSTTAYNGLIALDTYRITQGHKYLLGMSAKMASGVSNIMLGFNTQSGVYQSFDLSNATNWTRFETIKSAIADRTSDRLNIYRWNNTFENLMVKEVVCFDLTQMFGSVIADYIYSLEQTTTGAGITFFRNLFPNSYYEYNAGTLMSVNVSGHKNGGFFNIWDEEWESGLYDTKGLPGANGSFIRSKNFIPVSSNTQYYYRCPSNHSDTVFFYDINKDHISHTSNVLFNNGKITTPNNCRYIKFCRSDSTYNNDICINLFDANRNGAYEPYEFYTYPLDSTLILRGILKLDANNKLYYDGDSYEADGTVTRKYGIDSLGSLSWSRIESNISGNYYFLCSTRPLMKRQGNNDYLWTNLFISNGFVNIPSSYFVYGTANDKTYGGYDGYAIRVKDDRYTDAESFKTAMSDVYLIYELATPTTESIAPYQDLQLCNGGGTEEFIDTRAVSIPVQAITEYPSADSTTIADNLILNTATHKESGLFSNLDKIKLDEFDISMIENVNYTTSINNLNSSSLTGGCYYYSGNSTGAPTTSAGHLIYLQHKGSNYGLQIAAQNSSGKTPLIYARLKNGSSTFGDWRQMFVGAGKENESPTTFNNVSLVGYYFAQASYYETLPTNESNHYYSVLCFGYFQLAFRFGTTGTSTFYTRYYVNSKWYPWVEIKSLIPSATTSSAGLMTASDKTKLDGIAVGAQVNPSNATTSAAGLMSATDKIKLDNLDALMDALDLYIDDEGDLCQED